MYIVLYVLLILFLLLNPVYIFYPYAFIEFIRNKNA